MNTKTINSKTMLSLFLCLSNSISYCPSMPAATLKLQICSRTLALLGIGAGSGVLGNTTVKFGLEKLERHKETERERARIEAFIKKEEKEKKEQPKTPAYWLKVKKWKKNNPYVDSQSKS